MTEPSISPMGPVRDRRRGKRFMTLRNAGKVLIALVVIFAVISLWSERRRIAPGQFGRLYEKRTRDLKFEPKRPEVVVVEDTNIHDQTAPDPMLLDGVDREQWLGVNQALGVPNPPAAVDPLAAPAATSTGAVTFSPGKKRPLSEKGKVKVSGGAGGLTVEVEPE